MQKSWACAEIKELMRVCSTVESTRSPKRGPKVRGEKKKEGYPSEQIKMADSEFPKANPPREEEGGGDVAAIKQRREPAMPEHGKSQVFPSYSMRGSYIIVKNVQVADLNDQSQIICQTFPLTISRAR